MFGSTKSKFPGKFVNETGYDPSLIDSDEKCAVNIDIKILVQVMEPHGVGYVLHVLLDIGVVIRMVCLVATFVQPRLQIFF